jgi:hypothetical protein
MPPISHSERRTLEVNTELSAVLPQSLVDLVDSYLVHAEALETISLAPDGKPVDSETNRTTIAEIKSVLTNATCDRGIIRQIFRNAGEGGYTAFLNQLMNELRADGKPIILDKVDFSDLNLSDYNFNKVSLVQANFNATVLENTTFLGADLTDVQNLNSASGCLWLNAETIITGIDDHFRQILTMCGESAVGLKVLSVTSAAPPLFRKMYF